MEIEDGLLGKPEPRYANSLGEHILFSDSLDCRAPRGSDSEGGDSWTSPD
jgi:hypothetical protein